MHPARRFLHALLCLALVANGAGPAWASRSGDCGTHAAHGLPVHDQRATVAPSPHEAHGHAGHATVGDAHAVDVHDVDAHAVDPNDADRHATHAASMTLASDKNHCASGMSTEPSRGHCPDGDCDDCSAACGSTCMVHPLLVLLPAPSLPTLPARGHNTSPPMHAHPAPPLPDPIRPPIDQA